MLTIPNNLLIAGEWRPSADGARLPVIDPANETQVDAVPVATGADLDHALAAAQLAWHVWRETDVWTRSATLRKVGDLLRARVETIAAVLTEEQGKVLAEARGEVRSAADVFDWYADEARRHYGRIVEGHSRSSRQFVIHQPVGPVAAFTPWNFPALLPARKLAPAIAAGCSIILKPAEESPRTAMLLAQACQDAGVPDGVVNVVTGDPAMISRHVIASPVIRKVTLTGSVPVGEAIMRQCADGIKPVTLELGGHSPVLVFADADVEAAAEMVARGKFRNNGQVCIAASRVYVHESIAARFTECFVRVTRSLRLGDGREIGTEVGPLASRRRLEAVESLVADAVQHGAAVCCGGQRAARFARGFFFEPTVLTGGSERMRLMQEEPFGPIAPITTFRDLDEALVKANATDYGLAGYVFTRDTRRAFLAAEGLDVGMVGINTMLIATAEMPFGGVKKSGLGREGGSEGLDAYTVTKTITLALGGGQSR